MLGAQYGEDLLATGGRQAANTAFQKTARVVV
jgi:hypothetical protein